jgi:hypothetical protein
MTIAKPRFALLTALAVSAGFMLDELSVRYDITGLMFYFLTGLTTFLGGYVWRWQAQAGENDLLRARLYDVQSKLRREESRSWTVAQDFAEKRRAQMHNVK